MKVGRPRSIKLKKNVKRKRSRTRIRARRPSQIAATVGRRRVRRRKGR